MKNARHLNLKAGLLGLLAVALLALPTARPAEAAGIVVNTFIDAASPVTDGGCTLREAIVNADFNLPIFPDCATGTGGDTITFSDDLVITLVAPLPELTDPAGLTIDGTGKTVVVLGVPSSFPNWRVMPGAALQLLSVILSSPPASGGASGIENNGGTLAVYRSTLHELRRPLVNKAGSLLVMADTSVLSNTESGLVNSGTAIVGRSLFYDNLNDTDKTGNGGGAIYNSGTLTLANSTLSGNRAGGWIRFGGGLLNAGTATLTNVTIAENQAYGLGGGIRNEGGTVQMANSVLSGNTESITTPVPSDCSGALTSTGPNVISAISGCTVTGTPPIVGPAVLALLAHNGGPTGTHALLSGSPALNAGDPAVCAAFPVEGKDQRGVARPQGPACDLGAYESDLAGTIGGRNLKITTGSIDLSWQGGTVQTGYTLLRVDTSTSAIVTTPLGASATSYSDTTAVNGVTYCYVLLPTGPSGLLGLSDLLCGVTGSASGPQLPVGFTLALNQTSTATMTLTSGGPEGTYLLMVPLDGSGATTTAVTPGTFTKPVPPEGACFVVIADGFGGTYGFSNQLCAVPGVGTLRLSGVGATLEEVAGRLALMATALPGAPARGTEP